MSTPGRCCRGATECQHGAVCPTGHTGGQAIRGRPQLGGSRPSLLPATSSLALTRCPSWAGTCADASQTLGSPRRCVLGKAVGSRSRSDVVVERALAVALARTRGRHKASSRDQWCRRCGCEGTPRDTVCTVAHEPFGWRPTTLVVTLRRYRCTGCAHVWRQDTTKAAQPRAKLSRRGLR
jgi:hypothetical protein